MSCELHASAHGNEFYELCNVKVNTNWLILHFCI
jgi:hypothetical protein